jgi:hypothetical protein
MKIAARTIEAAQLKIVEILIVIAIFGGGFPNTLALVRLPSLSLAGIGKTRCGHLRGFLSFNIFNFVKFHCGYLSLLDVLIIAWKGAFVNPFPFGFFKILLDRACQSSTGGRQFCPR